MAVTLAQGDRIRLRDRPWIVRRVNQATDNYCLVEIEALDGDRPAHLSVAIPPEDPERLAPEALTFDLSQLDSLPAWSHAHRILNATLVRDTGLLSGARFGRVALEAYQVAPTLRLLSKPRPSLLIADDVGLGKTIEAGLALLELMARGRVSRALVVSPPGLMEQWREELFEKFGLGFTIIGNASDLAQAQSELPAGVSPWDALPRVITSIDFIKKETVRHRALRKHWDLVIVDEAHALAESGTPDNPYRTQRTRLGVALRDASRGLLLLTATPHNGYSHAFRSLLELVEPTVATFRGTPEDVQRRIESARIRRMKTQIRRRLPEGGEERVFPQRQVDGIPVRPADPRWGELLRQVGAYCSRTARQAAGTDEAELVGFAMQIIKKRSLSSRAALLKTLDHRLKALQEALEGNEAPEEVPNPSELRDYQADLPLKEAESERIARRILRSAIPKEEKLRRSEVRALTSLRRLLRQLPEADPKLEALVSELRRVVAEGPTEKVIVFTEYRDTLDAIQQRLDAEADLAGCYVLMHGGLSRRQRLARQDQFSQPDVRVLIATDAASEGLNLQHHCRRVLHMELPWNPNRLEQRNGRVDRYGQAQQPIIRYLFYPDSPEDDVLARLIEKIERMASDRISTPDVLGVLSGRGEIASRLVMLESDSSDVKTEKNALVRLFEDRTAEFVRDVQPLLVGSNGSDLDPNRLLDALHRADPLLPDDAALERTVLAILGSAASPDPRREGVYRIDVPWNYRGQGVQPVYPAATFRRSVAVRFRADEVDYLTPLHPLIQALATDARRRLVQVYPNVRGLPPRRLAARTIAAGEPASIVFTWLARIVGGTGLLEERLLAVRVSIDGQELGTPEANLRWLQDEVGGDVPRRTLESLFRDRFDALRDRAEAAARSWIQRRVAALREHRARQAEVLREDLERDVADRLKEIDAEEQRTRGLETNSGPIRQILLSFDERGSGRIAFETRRQAVAAYQEQRLREIAEFERVLEPEPPQPLGALFLVPEGEVR